MHIISYRNLAKRGDESLNNLFDVKSVCKIISDILAVVYLLNQMLISYLFVTSARKWTDKEVAIIVFKNMWIAH